MKLTPKQIETLTTLHDAGDWRSAYPGLHSSTLNSLEIKGLAESKAAKRGGPNPSNWIDWRITDKGLAALREASK